ncbi:G-type lectin S-receptor-like serine/threonine-protein kinase At5g24080 [Tasmannia lanceolata]|uniref:G-type lectin S-receptor-like serine/threonine-protein kinase At5g24080 n=1 Tax=Tasmannia lanceolata TaxID=3420 RepID=UPI004064023B
MAASWHTLLFLVLFELYGHSGTLVTGRILLGSRLSANENQTWNSDNGTFAFGFSPSDSPDEFQLAIWYATLPGNRTVVWSPNRNSPVGKQAIVELDSTGNLALIDGKSNVWSSNTSGQDVESAVLSDSGSLVLSNTTLHEVWQSFWHPSDTLLPGQPLTVSLELTAPKSPTHGGGYYSLQMLQQPTALSLALTYNSPESDTDLPESYYSNYSYWSSDEISNATGDVVAILDESGNFGIVYGENPAGTVYVYENDGGDRQDGQFGSTNRTVPRRVVIESNGNLRLYEWYDNYTNGSHQWVSKWAAVTNPCTIAGICGNGICNFDGTQTNSNCTCPPGTSPLVGHDIADGCLSDSLPPPGNCSSKSLSENSSSTFNMVEMAQTNYFSGASVIENYSDVSSSSECGKSCLSDCACVASVYGLSEEQTYCWILKSMVFGGWQDPSSTLFVKVGINSSLMALPRGIPGESRSRHDRVLVLPLVLCTSVLLCFLCLLLYYSVSKKESQATPIESNLMVTGVPQNFSFRDLQNATSNFSQLLGTGGFGSVYKGSLGDGTLVAVKKLERFLPHGEKEFITEVNTIGSMHHLNLVRLCGFCSEGSHRLLVYEFMCNGSLDKWIFPSYTNRDRLLDWKTRFHITIATAQGIAYFHEQCRNRIIHCDIKPENIILDENFCPKVSDFGLAKLMGREHSHVVTMVRGTRGYLAPEWVSNRPITVKADVYSYGMLLLEIIGGRRNVDMSLDTEDFFYPGWAFKELTNGTPGKVADRRLKGRVEEEELVRALSVAFWCIQDEVWLRPSMGEVVKMLEGSLEIKAPPMPQAVLEFVEEGLDHVYKAMKREFNPRSSYTINSHTTTSQATCSYSTMSPR